MILIEIKSHAQKIIETINKIDELESSLHDLTINPLSGNEVSINIDDSLIISVQKSKIEELLKSKLESLESELQDLRNEISM